MFAQVILLIVLLPLGIFLERRSARFEREREAALAAARALTIRDLYREED